MATGIEKRLTIYNDTGVSDIEVYINGKGEVYFEEADSGMFWFTISKEDWEDLKKFIDGQFNK